jgi:hypothetical protein
VSQKPTTRPLASPSRAGRAPVALWLLGVAGALILYVATLAPDLVWQDSGAYQLNACLLNLSRPGDAVRVHPWFLFVAHGIGLLGVNYAYAANLASAIGTALAVGNVLLLVRLVTGRTLAAVVAAVSLAVAHTVWAHAVMAETYGWDAAFLSAECLCVWAFLQRQQVHWLLLAALVNGVASSNHMMAVLGLAVLVAWTVWQCVRRRAPWWVLAAGAGCWIVGGTLYWIVLADEFQRSGSLVATFHSATVGQWGAAVFNVGRLPRLLFESVLYIGLNYPTPLILAILFGAVVLIRRRDSFSRFLVVLAALYLIWAARYDVNDRYAFFIPFYVLASVMIGVTAAWLLRDVGRTWLAAALVLCAVLPAGVYEVLPGVGPAMLKQMGLDPFHRTLPYRDSASYFLRPRKNDDWSARRFAQDVMAGVPARTVIIADSTAGAPLECLRQVEGQRPDLVISSPSFGLGSDVMRYWTSATDMLPQATAEERQVYVTSDLPDYLPEWVRKFCQLKPAIVINADTGQALLYEVKPRAAAEATQ